MHVRQNRPQLGSVDNVVSDELFKLDRDKPLGVLLCYDLLLERNYGSGVVATRWLQKIAHPLDELSLFLDASLSNDWPLLHKFNPLLQVYVSLVFKLIVHQEQRLKVVIEHCLPVNIFALTLLLLGRDEWHVLVFV